MAGVKTITVSPTVVTKSRKPKTVSVTREREGRTIWGGGDVGAEVGRGAEGVGDTARVGISQTSRWCSSVCAVEHNWP